MNDLTVALNKISYQFLQEARKSPQLLSDMARMEFYMAESYGGRTFTELLQNADDASSTRVSVLLHNGSLYFANNGRPFDERDLEAISRSGASSKKRGESIGYRGVGFKSVSSLSTETVISSGDVVFSFSKRLCAELLDVSEDDVPSIRIPLPSTLSPEENSIISELKKCGFDTVFIFRNATLEGLKREIDVIDESHFLFLHSIKECTINIADIIKSYIVSKQAMEDYSIVRITTDDRTQQWAVFDHENTSAAFMMHNGSIVPCSPAEAYYSCFLPTAEGCAFGCRLNADFSTDPARKHITLDAVSKTAIAHVADNLVHVAQLALKNPDEPIYHGVFQALKSNGAFSAVNMELDKQFKIKLVNNPTLKLRNGKKIKVSDYPVIPSVLEIPDSIALRTSSSFLRSRSLPESNYRNLNGLEVFLSAHSKEEFSVGDVLSVLTEKKTIESLESETVVSLLSSAIKEIRISEILGEPFPINLNKIYIPQKNGKAVPLSKLSGDSALIKEVEASLSPSEKKWFSRQRISPVKSTSSSPKSKNKTESNHNHGRLQKWRSAEEKCLEIEKTLGNMPRDVSLQNVGYDVESQTPDGRKRCIEVKSVKKDFAFTITNNEYTAAHQLQDDYYICLLYENNDLLCVKYIQNPLRSGKFEKRVRQWEWVCLSFQEESETSFDLV